MSVVWAINEKFVSAFEAFNPRRLGPHAVAPLPDLPAFPKDGLTRVSWVRKAKTLPGIRRAFGCGVHPWGWKRGNIVTAILENAGISKLAVQRRPWLPLTKEDLKWADAFVQTHGLKRFVTLEYNSYSLATPSLSWFANLVKHLPIRVVSIGASGDPALAGTVDARGTSFRQAKALISRSACFIGIGSGLSVVAATHGCEQPVVEMTSPQLSMVHIGYRRSGAGVGVVGTVDEAGMIDVNGGKGSVKIVGNVAHTNVRSNYQNLHGATAQTVAQAVGRLVG